MLGAHFDSWHASTGATDNAAGSRGDDGSDADPEAARASGCGEPCGSDCGPAKSRGCTARATTSTAHFAARRAWPADGAAEPGTGGRRRSRQHHRTGARTEARPREVRRLLQHRQRHRRHPRRLSAGQRRRSGPIFRAWMEPFRSIGMTTVTISNTGGTDHQSFDGVGLPGFQFIQDEVEYDTMTHHTNLDSYERLQPDDMRRTRPSLRRSPS